MAVRYAERENIVDFPWAQRELETPRQSRLLIKEERTISRMKSAVLVMGLASICLLHAEDPIPVQPNFYFKKMTGKWYPIATTKAITPERAVYAYTMQPLSNGDLVLKVDMPRDDACRRKRVVLHTIRSGVFTTADDKTTVHLVETDYDIYHIILFTKEEERDLFLYAREEEVSDEVKEKFKNRAGELSLDPEAIIYLPRTSPCPPADSK